MKRTAVFCVLFNTYDELYKYYDSICSAVGYAKGEISVDFFVADNTEHDTQEIILENAQNVRSRVFPFKKNVGYLRAVQKMMRESNIEIRQYDYIAISNVDLVMQKDALLRLCEYNPEPKVGWVAPSLLSEQEGRDRNPGMMKRYTAHRLKILMTMFRFPILMTAYRATFYKRHRMQRVCPEGQAIYAGHGSFMLFTKEYFACCGIPEFPMFLFGEELYFAELCRQQGLSVVYYPSIKIRDQEHASVGKMHRSKKYRYNYDALGYILRTFY